MPDYTIQSFPYNESLATVRKSIADFLNIIWPEPIEAADPHRAELTAQSFCCYANGLLVGYAGVIQKEIFHLDSHFRIVGLSCVAVLPAYQGHGVGTAVIKSATDRIEEQKNVDFGIFTCHPSLSSLYHKAGNWEVHPKVILIGSHDQEALSSQILEVDVLMRLFSKKAKAHEAAFAQEPICLDFPVGEFL